MGKRDGTVVCPGSYDPVTNGHLDIITRTSEVFDQVVVGVVNNPIRKERTLFTAEERKGFIEEATADLANVEVQTFSNLLVEFARELDANAIVKGCGRSPTSSTSSRWRSSTASSTPDIESIYVIASPHYSFLSSTGVKEMATFKGDVSDLVPTPSRQRWRSAWARGRLPDGKAFVGESLQKAEEMTASSPKVPLTRRLTIC